MNASSEKSKGSAFGSRFRAGSYSAFATVILIVIAVVLNLAAGALPASVTQIDMTANSLYTLSDQTRRIAKSLLFAIPLAYVILATTPVILTLLPVVFSLA